jgi:hypothetical protein
VKQAARCRVLDLPIAGAVPPLVCAWCRDTSLRKGHDMCVQNFVRELQSIDMLEGLGLDAISALKSGLASSGSGQRTVSGCFVHGHEPWSGPLSDC